MKLGWKELYRLFHRPFIGLARPWIILTSLHPSSSEDVCGRYALLIDADRVDVISAAHRIFTFNIGEIAPGITLRQGWWVADASVERTIFVHPLWASDHAGLVATLNLAARGGGRRSETDC